MRVSYRKTYVNSFNVDMLTLYMRTSRQNFTHVGKFILFHCGKEYRMIRNLCKICGFITPSVLEASKNLYE